MVSYIHDCENSHVYSSYFLFILKEKLMYCIDGSMTKYGKGGK